MNPFLFAFRINMRICHTTLHKLKLSSLAQRKWYRRLKISAVAWPANSSQSFFFFLYMEIAYLLCSNACSQSWGRAASEGFNIFLYTWWSLIRLLRFIMWLNSLALRFLSILFTLFSTSWIPEFLYNLDYLNYHKELHLNIAAVLDPSLDAGLMVVDKS